MRTLLLCVTLILTLGLVGAGAQDVAKGDTKAQTAFDQVALKKGVLMVKEFVEFGSFDKVQGEIAVLTDTGSASKTFALRVTVPYYNSKYDSGEATGVFDAKEVASALQAIEFMKKKLADLTSSAPYTEVTYRGAGDPEFGFYVSGNSRKLFFKANYKATEYFEVGKLDDLLKFFQAAKAKILELGGTV